MASHFKRPDKPVPCRLNLPDDDDILFHIYRHRLIDADMLRALLPHRSEQGLGRRLNKLRLAHYIDRPRQQTEKPRTEGGSDPAIYALDYRGAERLRDVHGSSVVTSGWKQKNAEIRGRSIQHTLNTTRFLVDATVAACQHGAVSLIHSDQIPQRGKNAGLVIPNSNQAIYSQVDWNGHFGRRGTSPDSLFALEYSDREDGKNRYYIFLETDQGTETVVPNARKLKSKSFFSDSSILKKLVIYAAIFNSQSHKERFRFNRFRVLFVTTTPKRSTLMQAAYREYLVRGSLNVRPDVFLFTDWQTWSKRKNAEFVVQDGLGKTFKFFA